MDRFNDLSIADLVLGLGDLVAAHHSDPDRPLRSAALARVDGDGIFKDELTALLTELADLPPELRGIPMKELMREADASFDRDGMILRLSHQVIALLTAPTADALAAVGSIGELVPLGITRAPYSTEAAHAATHAEALERHRAALSAIALPCDDTPTLFAVVERFVKSGLELDRLSSQRGHVTREAGDRAGAGALRSRAIGALHALREHVARALRLKRELPRDLDGQIFGFLDELQRLAAERAARRAARDGAGSPEETPEPGRQPT